MRCPARAAVATSTVVEFLFIPLALVRRAVLEGLSLWLQSLPTFSRAPWNVCGFAQLTPFAPITNQTLGAAIGQPTAPHAMDAC